MARWSGRIGHRGNLYQRMEPGVRIVLWVGMRRLARGSLEGRIVGLTVQARGWRGCRDNSRSFERRKRQGNGSLDYRSSGTLLIPDTCAAQLVIGEDTTYHTIFYISDGPDQTDKRVYSIWCHLGPTTGQRCPPVIFGHHDLMLYSPSLSQNFQIHKIPN